MKFVKQRSNVCPLTIVFLQDNKVSQNNSAIATSFSRLIWNRPLL